MEKKVKSILSFSNIKVGEHSMVEAIPNRINQNLNPFLLIHHHGPHFFKANNNGLPFGPHPHRGFETLTFIYSGEIEHKDSYGYTDVIKAGGIQWMTAGSGLVHSENLSKQMLANGGDMEIIQLWMNLPAALKMTKPNYQGFQQSDIPSWISADTKTNVAIIAGQYHDTKGAADSITDLLVLNIDLRKDGTFEIKTNQDHTILMYVLNGEVTINGKQANNNQLIQFESENDNILVLANSDTRFIYISGQPINEPIIAHGPFVMNTTAQIQQAFTDYQAGKMGKM